MFIICYMFYKIIPPLLIFTSLSSSRGQRPDTTAFSQIDLETFLHEVVIYTVITSYF
jgi:hypothetical protein